MDFGKLNDVSKVDFSLADDHIFTQSLGSSRVMPMNSPSGRSKFI